MNNKITNLTAILMVVAFIMFVILFCGFLELKFSTNCTHCYCFSSKQDMENSFNKGNISLDKNKDGVPCSSNKYLN